MMKNLLILLLFIFTASIASAQKIIRTENVTDHSIHIIGDNFEGIVFSEKYKIGLLIDSASREFTPNMDEIILTEKILDHNMDTLKNSWKQSSLIHKNLHNYLRQYFGYINKNGERIIYINSLDRGSIINWNAKWMNNFIGILDGGPAFWQIKINIDNPRLFDFMVNGSG